MKLEKLKEKKQPNIWSNILDKGFSNSNKSDQNLGLNPIWSNWYLTGLNRIIGFKNEENIKHETFIVKFDLITIVFNRRIFKMKIKC